MKWIPFLLLLSNNPLWTNIGQIRPIPHFLSLWIHRPVTASLDVYFMHPVSSGKLCNSGCQPGCAGGILIDAMCICKTKSVQIKILLCIFGGVLVFFLSCFSLPGTLLSHSSNCQENSQTVNYMSKPYRLRYTHHTPLHFHMGLILKDEHYCHSQR